MSSISCECCRGLGKILGLGNMKEKCVECKGVGYTSSKKQKDQDTDDFLNTKKLDHNQDSFENDEIKIVKKKMGRPKKIREV
jgi:hypothetical protein